ncbi:MAG TPA: SRPBCC family protein [Candidatus Limnocylindrales bacterium]|jgi:carbon monoxide dehydrogenase subunit G
MPRLHETIETRLPIDEAFEFVADFANCPAWDPNTVSSERLDPGPVAVGARYKLGVRQRGTVVPMEYRVVTWETGRRVVLAGEGSSVRATDEIRFQPTSTGTRIDYTADISLTGWMRLVEPLAGGAFTKIAKDAAAGMERALEDRAAAAAR